MRSLKRSGASSPLLMIADLIVLSIALYVALIIKNDFIPFRSLYHKYIAGQSASFILAGAFYIYTYIKYHLYRYTWRFASIEVLWSVVAANTLGIIFLALTQWLLFGKTMPATILILHYVFSILFIGGARILLRLSSLHFRYGSAVWQKLKKDELPKRVVILSSGATGARMVTSLRDEQDNPYHIVGILDDDPSYQGSYMRGAKVIGPLSRLNDLLKDNLVDEVIIALPQELGAKVREHVMLCRRRKIPVKVIPALCDVLNGKVKAQIEDIRIEDLLRRKPVKTDVAEIGGYLTGKRVLVTGAGGSIGSELSRQICALEPAVLVLLGHGENSIHEIHKELVTKYPRLVENLHTIIGSVSDGRRMEQVFRHFAPHVVFHAAAHKHVPIMEKNILEAVQNNIIGTYRIAEMCGTFGVSRMVLISSDKAVNPSCIMGATKAVCENIVRAMSGVYPQTFYVSVRFGNVLGSRGSVVPIFKEQINRGGPVTVTHPEMTRYFMSIPEAVQLVMQAGAIGKSGDLFILDMGDPIKIVDLAYDMIRLSGLEPGEDIQVAFSGIRPGEKLHEELSYSDELIETTRYSELFAVHRSKYSDPEAVMIDIKRFLHLLGKGDVTGIKALLGHIFPQFAEQSHLFEEAQTESIFDSVVRL